MVLSRRQLYAALVGGAVLVAVVAGLIAWRVWSSPSGPTLGQEPLAAAALLEPEQHLFADPVRARLELLVDRNRNWLPKIDALFTRPGRAFVVVGAAHIVGPDGLLAMLRTRGYAVEQM